jgi:hypothetical protein
MDSVERAFVITAVTCGAVAIFAIIWFALM